MKDIPFEDTNRAAENVINQNIKKLSLLKFGNMFQNSTTDHLILRILKWKILDIRNVFQIILFLEL